MIYVLNYDGKPLMPTNRCGKVRHMLLEGKAKVVQRCPFTIQLLYQNTNYTQPIRLGVDAGSKHIGMSATTETKEVYASEVELRHDITKLLSDRSALRKGRRSRKTRYRKPRFQNRKRGEKWLAPSIRYKIQTHIDVTESVCRILPITSITVETVSFDIQKIKNPEIKEVDYQRGDQLGFWNVREYVLFRDGHMCQCCRGKSKDKILNVHHIESRRTGGDAPNNLITLCKTCHTGYHSGMVQLPKKVHRGMSFRDATFMGIMRWAFYNELKMRYPDVHMTYGYITKNTRIRNGLPKEHYIDARCISGNPTAIPLGTVYYQKKVRRHNRQIHKSKILKGGIRKRNQAEYLSKGFRLFDRVQYQGKQYFIFGRRKTGFFDIRTLDGTKVNKGSLSCKKIQFLETPHGYLTEERKEMA